MSRRPGVLVTGSHRSGTTWVGKMLACAPDMDYVHEPFNADEQERFADPSIGFKIKTWFLCADGAADEDELQQALDRRFRRSTEAWRNAWHVCRERGASSLRTPLRFGKHLVLRTARPQRVLMKDPIALFSAPWLHERFGMQVVCMIRNPLAFAGSLKKWDWTFDFDHLVRQKPLLDGRLSQYADQLVDFAEHARDIVDQACLLWNCFHHVIGQYKVEYPGWCYVRYEDLALNPVDGFRRLCERLDLVWTPDLETKILESASAEGVAEADSPSFQKRDSRQAVQTWRRRLTPEEVERIVEATRECASPFYHWTGDDFESTGAGTGANAESAIE